MKTTILYVLHWIMYPETPIHDPKEGKKDYMKLQLSRVAVRSRSFTFIMCLLTTLSFCKVSNAQLAISENTLFTGTGEGILTVDSSIINHGEMTTTEQFTVVLGGEGEITSTASLSFPRMLMVGSNYDINADIAITDSLLLQSGTLTTSSVTRLVLIDSAFAVSIDSAYVNGSLFTTGSGEKFFPIGKNGQYTPTTLTNVEGTNTYVGLESHNYDLGLTDLPPGVTESSHDWHWTLYSEDGYEGSPIILPITEQDQTAIDNTSLIPVVIESDWAQENRSNLGGVYAADEGTIRSTEKAGDFYILIGFAEEINPIIHNIMTPGNDNDNPYLIIDGIDALTNNEVILIDRWGNEMYRKSNFRNFNETDNIYNGEFDFLPSGNYVCLLRYGGQSETSMVTVIKE